jgi:putative endopeptidase
VGGEQRVFLGWAQVWRAMMRDASGVKEGDPLYVKPEDRVRIW